METIEHPLPSAIWETLHPAARALILLQQQRIAQLAAQLAALPARVEHLEARLGQNSHNSSRPPSSDAPPPPPRRPPRPTGRTRGGQPGHEAHQRLLLPPEQVDAVVEHWPEHCAHCQQPLPSDPALVVADPERHQVTEAPPLRATVTEHRLHRLRCPGCGGQTRAALPPGIPPGAFGPRLAAIVALLSGRYRLSRREVAAIAADLLGVELAVGSVDGRCQQAAAALAQPMAQLEAALPQAPALHADETSWRLAGRRCWLWVVVGAALTVFRVAQSRGRVVIHGLIGADYAGRLITDRYPAYGWLAPERRQVCWAHLLRDFQAVADAGRAGRGIAVQVLAVLEQVFHLWHQARDHPELREWLTEQMAPLQQDVRWLLELGTQARDPKLPTLCAQLIKLWPALWTFVAEVGIEPTNNRAEQAIRPAVLWR
jgi:transposase